MDPTTLAADLGIAPSILRAWLRRTYPRPEGERGAPWTLTPDQVEAAHLEFPGVRPSPPLLTKEKSRARADSDESYVIDLCEVLGERARRQHRFDWLLGDPGSAGARASCLSTPITRTIGSWSSIGNASTTSPWHTSTSPTCSPSLAFTAVSSAASTTAGETSSFPRTAFAWSSSAPGILSPASRDS